MKRCISCGKSVVEYAEFPCANCKKEIVRCNYCRENKNRYNCECGFKGP